MILVVDASVTIAWIATDEKSAYAEAVLAACGTDRAVVPALWHWEIANTLVVLERKRRLSDASAVFASVLKNVPVTLENGANAARGLDEIALSRRHQLSVYDAAYLALAKTAGLSLATLDSKLMNAAKAERLFFAA